MSLGSVKGPSACISAIVSRFVRPIVIYDDKHRKYMPNEQNKSQERVRQCMNRLLCAFFQEFCVKTC